MAGTSRRPRRLFTANTTAVRSIAANATIVAAAFVVSRVLGMVREILIAARFGTSETYDAYVAAFRIPDLLFLVVMSGAFGSAFIPIFGGFLARGDREQAWRLANSVLTFTLVVLGAVAVVVLILANPIIERIIIPDAPPGTQELAANLTRLLLLSPLLLGLGAAGKGMLEAQDRFTLPAIAPVLYNLGIIIGAIALVPIFGVYGLVAGVIGGAFAHAAIQFADLFRHGLRFKPNLSLQTTGLSDVGRLMAPRLVGQAAFQVNLIVMTNFASGLGEGRISALNIAYALFMLPHGVLALSLSTVIFPMMARQYELGQLDEMKGTLRRALGPLMFLTLPAAVGLYAFRTSIVQMIFEFGSFTPESTALVAEALGFFALGLIAFAVVEATTRAFYAMQDTRTPVIASIFTVAANIMLSWYLAPRLGHGGLALSISLTTTIEMIVLLAVLSHRTGGLGGRLWMSFVRMVLAAAILATVSLWLAEPLHRATDPGDGRSLASIVVFGLALATAGATYLVAAYYLRIPELQQILSLLQRRLGRAG